MFGIHSLWLFVLSGLLLNITPGPDTAYIVGRIRQSGRVLRWIDRALGGLLIYLGVRIATLQARSIL